MRINRTYLLFFVFIFIFIEIRLFVFSDGVLRGIVSSIVIIIIFLLIVIVRVTHRPKVSIGVFRCRRKVIYITYMIKNS